LNNKYKDDEDEGEYEHVDYMDSSNKIHKLKLTESNENRFMTITGVIEQPEMEARINKIQQKIQLRIQKKQNC